ncbi:response regulator [Thioclava atlantica]|uniref:LuxR family transcriptional regulator n=1 Tax=Thioclava atlantica TaxID=1317124 RepID=A0A085TUS1_9RHOB|nr:response regulator transcription factor [Thioclava atlantica]KFE34468.1 LuxR family transcriptional regulator [Thioclava atlantica]
MSNYGEFTAGIVDDHPIFRQGLQTILAEDFGFATVHQGSSARDALEIATRHRPDILFLDLTMPGGGLEALRTISQADAGTHCVLLTACDAPDTAIEAMNIGARGYILKGVGIAELDSAIEAVLRGGTFVSPSFATALLRAAQSNAERHDSDASLTHRELQVLHELEQGRTNREIASTLSISERTVKFYMTNIMQKYGVKNRVAAVMAYRQGHEKQPAAEALHRFN